MAAKGVVIIGVQWGDEGKGKIVDYYAQDANIVARFQGGNNAGHTLVVKGKSTVLHLIPSGILHKHTTCVVGSGVVLDPHIFLQEVETLKQAGLDNLHERLFISARAHLIMDYHKELDAAREGKKAGKIGTTKRGIGPAYEDRASRRGIRVADLFNAERLKETLRANLEEKSFLLREYYGAPPLKLESTVEHYVEIGKRLKPFVRDVSAYLSDQIESGKRVLFEGAQGILLDIDYGTYPYVTSSHTLPSQAALGLGARMPEDCLFIGIMKAYSTRVGDGPFPTELNDAVGEKLRADGREFGSTTGRPRRCGWLDLVAVKYAIRVSGIKNLAITKADVLAGHEEVKVCVAYEVDGKRVNTLSPDTSEIGRVKPIYETLPGWQDLSAVRKPADLPKTFLNYINFIEEFTGTRVNLVSTGADREAVIDIQAAF